MLCKKFEYIKNECKICDGKGYAFNNQREILDGKEEDFAKQCECMKKMINYCRYEEANIPREYFDLSLDDFKVKNPPQELAKRKVESIVNDIEAYYRNGRSLLLYGKRGTGKTMLAMEIIKAAARAGHSIYYDFYPMVFNEFTKKGYTSDEVKLRYDTMFAKTDLMVLDELVKEKDYFNSAEMASDDVSKRFLEMNVLKRRSNRPTILISNIQEGMKDIEKHYGPYVASMMAHKFDVIDLSDKNLTDFRLEGK